MNVTLFIGISAIVIGVAGQLYSRTPLPLKALAWTIALGLTFAWVVSH